MNDVHYSSETPEWSTPQPFFDALDAEFRFTLDAAATAENAKCDRFFTVFDNGLMQPWTGVVWLNPPYGTEIGRWMRRAFYAAQDGAVVVALVPVRTDTRWWHDYVMRAAEVRLVRGRIRFGESDTSAPFPSAVVVFRPGRHTPVFVAMGALSDSGVEQMPLLDVAS